MDSFPSSTPDIQSWCKSLISAKQKIWNCQLLNSTFADKIAQDFSLDPLVAHIAALRIPKDQSTKNFFNPSLREQLPEPLSLKNMEKAVNRTLTAISNKETIAIITDYDVDGTTSAASLLFFLRALKCHVVTYVPERLSEGYGPNPHAVQSLHDQHKPSLLFTLDCGTSASSSLAHAQSCGIDVIVLDHHQPPDLTPSCHALVNPRQFHDHSNLGYLAAVGVVFFFLIALNRELRRQNFYSPTLKEPPLLQILDLVALGTVCDMVPLVHTNRLLVTQGLKIMRNSVHPGIKALLNAAKIKKYPLAKDLGFAIGPLINAASRMGQSHLALTLLSCQDEQKAQEYAHTLVKLNQQRKQKEIQNIHLALNIISASPSSQHLPFTHISSPDLHLGVAGILASHLVQQHQKPAFVTIINPENQTAKGSARSLEGFNIGACLHAAHQDHILENAGGHTMAGGDSIQPQHTQKFQQFLSSYFQQFSSIPPKQTLNFDGILFDLSLKNLSTLSQQLLLLEPFGINNPQPVILFPNIAIKAQVFKDSSHILCSLSSIPKPSQKLSVMAFRAVGTPFGKHLLAPPPSCHALLSLGSPSSYKNQPDLQLLDIAWQPS
jgi:single-stranded-DNA-specific exonuclease